MRSIIDPRRRCHLCGSTEWLELHHVMGGPCRKASERYGLTVWLCHWCHNEPPNGVHHNRGRMDALRAEAQGIFERTHTREEWMRVFRRNYL